MDYQESEVGVFHHIKDLKTPDKFSTSELTINDKNITVYENGIFTMVYGINEKGEKNFYLFDKEKNSIISPKTLGDEPTRIVDIQKYILYVFSGLLLIINIVLIVILLKQRKEKTNEASNQ